MLLNTFTFLLSLSLAAIHGVDDTRLSQAASAPDLVLASKSVAALVKRSKLSPKLEFAAPNLVERQNFCPSEAYSNLPSLAHCSGTLIAPDLILTTFHCVRTQQDCDQSVWAFGYRAEKLNAKNPKLSAQETYSCRKIIASHNHLLNFQDYTVVQLDRPVLDRQPLKFRTQGQVSQSDLLAIIGHPYGLPSITSENGQVLDNSQEHLFSTDLDAFAGNSGSPVINQRTLEIEGVFVRGGRDTDVDWDSQNLCKKWYRCDGVSRDCETEDVTRVTSIPLDQILKQREKK